jgi:hypothetical protein
MILALIQVSATGDTNSDTGGRTAAFALALVAVVPLFVRSLDLRAPRWLPYAVGGISFVIPVGLWALVHSGRDSLAWSAYGGLQVLRAGWEFADLFQVLRWVDCQGCSQFDANYGPGLLWINQLLFGTHLVGLTVIVAITLAAAMSLAIGWLVSQSGALGGGLLLVAVFGGAWILLLDRANLDALVILLPIVIAFALRKRNSIWLWTAAAIGVWVLGTWKFYPFFLGIMLIPALRLRRGWIILTTFGFASVAFMLIEWSSFRKSSAIYDTFLIVYDFPALGRTAITSRLLGNGSFISSELVALVIVVMMCVLALIWGIATGKQVPASTNWIHAMLASAGSTLFLVTILVSGFGYQYKAAFLLLGAPLIGALVQQRQRSCVYTSLVLTGLIAITSVVGYSILLTSMAGLVAGSVLLGMSLRILGGYVLNRGESSSSATGPRIGTRA